VKGVRITEEQKDRALRLYASGRSYADIETASGVSKAALSELVKRRGEEDPDLLMVHQLAAQCREKRVAPEVFLRGASVIDQVEEAGSSLGEVAERVLPFVTKYGDRSAEYAEQGVAYAELVGAKGWTFEELVAETQKLERKRDGLAAEIEEEKALRGALDEQAERSESRLDRVEDLETIRAALLRIGKRPSDGAAVITKAEKLLAAGVSFATLEAIGTEAEKIGLKADDVPATVARLVKEYGSLEAGCHAKARELRALERQKEAAGETVEGLKEQKKGLKESCLTLSREERHLRRSCDALAQRQLAEEEAHRRAMDRQKAETERWCQARIEEAEAAASKEEERKEIARVNEEMSERRAKENADRDSASVVWFNRAVKGLPVTWDQLKALHQKGGVFYNLPLPEGVRNAIAEAADSILTDDMKQKQIEANNKLARTKESCTQILRATYAIKEKTEARVELLNTVERKMVESKGSIEVLEKSILAEPRLLAKALRDAPDDRLIDTFVLLSQSERDRVREILPRAGARARQEEDDRWNRWVHDSMVRALREALGPAPSAHPPPPYVPPPVKTKDGVVTTEIIDEPVIEDGTVQYDEYGFPRYRRRVVRRLVRSGS
jgi:hypothetical protein